MTYKKNSKCLICGNTHLELVLDLGDQLLTGIFPASRFELITSGPLRLVKCTGNKSVCGLLQLDHIYDQGEMYGKNYGYRSGLNPSMVSHLREKVKKIQSFVVLSDQDLVIDIGSNDGTTLSAYPDCGLKLVGIDPTGSKFQEFYPPHAELIADFFTANVVTDRFQGQKAKVISSFAMFYDLEDPTGFMREVDKVLADDGIWMFEQSYMPAMLEMNAYDTVCHEHLEFYALSQIKWMTDRVGFKIIDVEFNDVNGGSFSVTVCKEASKLKPRIDIDQLLREEANKHLDTLSPYLAFAERVKQSKQEILEFIKNMRHRNQTVMVLGASTKGNVLLQYCGLSEKELPFAGDVNSEKFGCFTPGSWIPIISEEELLNKNPDYLIVLPWHFKRFFLNNAKFSGINLVFPLPRFEIISSIPH